MHIEDELRMRSTLDRPLEHLPGEYWEKQLEPETVFTSFEVFQYYSC